MHFGSYVSHSAVIVVLLFIGCSGAISLSDAKNVPLAIITSNTIELTPAKVGHVISADLLSQTTIAAISENVDKLVYIVLPKLSYTRLAYDANYNKQQDTHFLSNALDSMSSVLYPAVSNIDHLSTGGLTTLHVKSLSDMKNDEILKGRNVQIKLDAMMSLHDADVIFGNVLKLLNSTGKSFAIVYTADEPDEWIRGIPSNEDHSVELTNLKEEVLARYKRQASRKAAAKAKAAPTAASFSFGEQLANQTIVQYTNSCFLFFAQEFNLKIKNTTTGEEYSTKIKAYRPAEASDANCTLAGKRQTFSVPLKITDSNNLGNFTSLQVVFDVKMKNPWEWIVDNITVTYSAPKLEGSSVTFKPTWLTAQMLFSFHCNNPDKIQKIDKSNALQAEIVFKTVQVQAYDVVNSKFGWQCDCVGFFTSAIWAGLFVSAIYLLIIALALVMLMNLETMDRFEDPKGQGLKIQASG